MKDILSPNFDERAQGYAPDMLLLHYTGMKETEESIARLMDPTSKVSAHYLVAEDGSIIRLVPEEKRAWHAGVSFWKGETDINSCSIGIEIQNPGHEFGYSAFPDRQIDGVIILCQDILSRHKIPRERVLGHSDVAPNRKRDPGELFPWQHLSREGVGLWPTQIIPSDSNEIDIRTLQKNLAKFGYEINASGENDQVSRAVITAFQRHWQQDKVDGVPDAMSVVIAQALSQV